MFFNIAFVAIYIVLFWTTGLRFIREFVINARWYRNMENGGAIENLFQFLLTAAIFISGITLGPITYVIVERRYRVKLAKMRAENQERQRRNDEHCARIKAENERRKPLREKWLKDNPLHLYYNVMNGITVVMTPSSHEIADKWTKRRILDGEWESEFLLCPTNQQAPFFIFTTKEGAAKVTAAIQDYARYKIAGKRSTLQDLQEKHAITLERKEDIFVPYVSEVHFTFRNQSGFFPDGGNRDIEKELVVSQIPTELREL